MYRGQAAGFEHKHLAAGKREQSGGNAGGLPRPRRSFQDQVLSGAQVAEDFGNERVDGETQAIPLLPQLGDGRPPAMLNSEQ